MKTIQDIYEENEPRTTHQILECIHEFFIGAGFTSFFVEDGRLQVNVPVTLPDGSPKHYGVFVWAREHTPGFGFQIVALRNGGYTEDLSEIPDLVRNFIEELAGK